MMVRRRSDPGQLQKVGHALAGVAVVRAERVAQRARRTDPGLAFAQGRVLEVAADAAQLRTAAGLAGLPRHRVQEGALATGPRGPGDNGGGGRGRGGRVVGGAGGTGVGRCVHLVLELEGLGRGEGGPGRDVADAVARHGDRGVELLLLLAAGTRVALGGCWGRFRIDDAFWGSVGFGAFGGEGVLRAGAFLIMLDRIELMLEFM